MDDFDLSKIHSMGEISLDQSKMLEGMVVAAGLDITELNAEHILRSSWPCQMKGCAIDVRRRTDDKTAIMHSHDGVSREEIFNMRLGGHTVAQHDAVEDWLLELHPDCRDSSIVDFIMETEMFKGLVEDYASAITSWRDRKGAFYELHYKIGGMYANGAAFDALAAYCHLRVNNSRAGDIPDWINDHIHRQDFENLFNLAFAIARARY